MNQRIRQALEGGTSPRVTGTSLSVDKGNQASPRASGKEHSLPPSEMSPDF